MQYLCLHTAAFVALFVLSQTNALTDNITLPEHQCECKENASALLDVAKEFVEKAKNLYPDCIENNLECGKKQKSLVLLEFVSNLITGAKNTYQTCLEPECPKDFDEKPIDCSEVLKNGKKTSGIYTIWPKNRTATARGLSVYCDMDTDGGGWTVIQRRGQFSSPEDYFDNVWHLYKIGFGDLEEEFWLGNDNIHSISNQGNYTIRFDMKASDGDTGYAEYDTFWIEDELSKYKLHISGYNGSGVGDSMYLHDNMKFTTKGEDNSYGDMRMCIFEKYEGAWWYRGCVFSSMNGLNQPGADSPKGITWRTWKSTICLAGVEMKLRPKRV